MHLADLNIPDWLPFLLGIQIGPRIRVGGSLGRAGQNLKIGVGKVANVGGKVVSLFNPALGTMISAAGDVLDTSDGKFDFGRAAKNAVLQYGVGKVANVAGSKLGGLFNRAGNVGGDLSGAGDALNHVSQSVRAGGSLGNVVGDAASNAGRFRSIASKAGSFLGGKDGFGMDDVLKYGSAAGKAYGAYDDMSRRNRYEDMAKAEFARRAPLRDRAMQLMLDDSRPDTSDLRDPMDPAGRYRRVSVGSRL